jgi:hypothetical protein
MITIQNIKDWSKPHPIGLNNGARQTRIGNSRVEFSIVGGGTGLYGDFDKTFEVAIFDKKTGNFITVYYYGSAGDDIITYMSGKDLEELVNSVIREDDLVIG